MIVSYSVL
uniref:Uncharacterized protein n=1 Tax=Arundo donax TaxID=35708 RepID=A0A0A9H993_ARUDO